MRCRDELSRGISVIGRFACRRRIYIVGECFGVGPSSRIGRWSNCGSRPLYAHTAQHILYFYSCSFQAALPPFIHSNPQPTLLPLSLDACLIYRILLFVSEFHF